MNIVKYMVLRDWIIPGIVLVIVSIVSVIYYAIKKK